MVKLTFPVFSIYIVYSIISFKSFDPLLLTSVTVATLVTSIDGEAVNVVSVGSSMVFPSVSSPSSDLSKPSLVLPGLLPVRETTLDMNPESTSDCVIT